jgi:HK97 family phage portal protein
MWPFKKPETRVASSDPFLGEFLGARFRGRPEIEKASGQAIAHRCMSVISETLAAVPMKLFQEGENGDRTDAKSHPLYGVLHDNFNETHTAFEGREFLISCILKYGNAFAKIERNGKGQVTALHPMLPGSVTVECLPSGRLRYQHTRHHGGTETLLQDEVLHLRYRTRNGFWGISPIEIAHATFGLALAQQDTAGAAAENSFRPAGALVFPDKLATGNQAGSKENVIAKFKERFIGSLKANEVMVLDGGAKFETFQFNSKDSEFLESRKLSNLDICSVFGVPPSCAGIVEQSNYANSQEESKSLVQRCLMPMARRIEASMNSALLTPESRKTFCIEHVLDGLTRGDIVTRYNAYAVGRNGGWLNVNQIRAFENMSNIGSKGDTYAEPMNMAILGAANDNRHTIDEDKVA